MTEFFEPEERSEIERSADWLANRSSSYYRDSLSESLPLEMKICYKTISEELYKAASELIKREKNG